MRHIKGWALLLLGVLVIAFSSSALAADKRVSIGYIATYTPWMAGVASGLYEDATGYDIQWREYGSGIEAVAALSRGEIQLSYLGITPAAGAVSAGMALEIFWVVADIDQSEALVVRRGSGIVKPQDLRRKRLAAPIGSTAHFHLLFALDQFGIPKDAVEIVNMSPAEIGEAWRDGSIDGAYIWEPTQGRLLRNGEVLIHSGDLGAWGRSTFDAFVAQPKWSARNPRFMVAFVKAIAGLDDSYKKNRRQWSRASANLQDLVSVVGGTHGQAERSLRLYRYPSLRQQASRKWLGDGSAGGVARALASNAAFLYDQGVIKQLSNDYGIFVNPEWVLRARVSD